VFVYLNVAVPEPEKLPPTKDEWALVLGGASSVGKMAAQVSTAMVLNFCNHTSKLIIICIDSQDLWLQSYCYCFTPIS
jgi:hypothetical protein